MFRATTLPIIRSIIQSNVPDDGQICCPKHVELIWIINKPLLLLLVGFPLYHRSSAHTLFHILQVCHYCIDSTLNATKKTSKINALSTVYPVKEPWDRIRTPEGPISWGNVTIFSKGTANRLWRILSAVNYADSARLATLGRSHPFIGHEGP